MTDEPEIKANLIIQHVQSEDIGLIGATSLGGIQLFGIDPDVLYIDFKRVSIDNPPSQYLIHASHYAAFEALKDT